MSKMSAYLEDSFLKYVFRNTQVFAPPSAVYLALFSTAPDDAGVGAVELAGAGYARTVLSTGAAGSGIGSYFSSPVAEIGGGMSSQNSIEFYSSWATANWAAVVAYGIYDALALGNLLVWGPLPSSVIVEKDFRLKIGNGRLYIVFR